MADTEEIENLTGELTVGTDLDEAQVVVVLPDGRLLRLSPNMAREVGNLLLQMADRVEAIIH